jgi:hypothetical protein
VEERRDGEWWLAGLPAESQSGDGVSWRERVRRNGISIATAVALLVAERLGDYVTALMGAAALGSLTVLFLSLRRSENPGQQQDETNVIAPLALFTASAIYLLGDLLVQGDGGRALRLVGLGLIGAMAAGIVLHDLMDWLRRDDV